MTRSLQRVMTLLDQARSVVEECAKGIEHALGMDDLPPPAGPRKPAAKGTRRLSKAGREAISRAAKRRWAAHRKAAGK